MNTKLTLSLDKEVIEKAKKVAKSNGRTLSNLIEWQLKLLMKDTNTDEIHPEINRLMGKMHLPSNFNHETEIKELWGKK